MAPVGMRPCSRSQASRSATVSSASASSRARARMSTTTAGPMRRPSGTRSAVHPFSSKWIGASRCVPPCSAAEKSLAAYQYPPAVRPLATRRSRNGVDVGQYTVRASNGYVRSTSPDSEHGNLSSTAAGETSAVDRDAEAAHPSVVPNTAQAATGRHATQANEVERPRRVCRPPCAAPRFPAWSPSLLAVPCMLATDCLLPATRPRQPGYHGASRHRKQRWLDTPSRRRAGWSTRSAAVCERQVAGLRPCTWKSGGSR